MKITDYIIKYIIDKGITDIFGYPGGVICHLIDSATKYENKLKMHINYHEQAAAFAACGYAQETCNIGVAFATSGPGATNLMTGIANAYFDSIPLMLLTGQVDTYGLKGDIPVRQRGFQETDVISMVKSVTKYAVRVDDPKQIKYELEKAYQIATTWNPGPVLLDLPADVQRANVDIEKCSEYCKADNQNFDYVEMVSNISSKIKIAKRPCLIIGNGVKQAGVRNEIRQLIEIINVPTVFSMPAFDTLPYNHKLNFGFIGANGQRYANFILGKSDLIITIGSRMDLKQVGADREKFASQAKIIRIDIDEGNLAYKVHLNEHQVVADIKQLIPFWMKNSSKYGSDEWISACTLIKDKLIGYDDEPYTTLLREFGEAIPEEAIITADVGQSELWVAQQIRIKNKQSAHVSAGHGTMGYSLPAAIGSSYGRKVPVFSFNGDGGVQMNIQELQYLKRDHLPVKVIIMNNHALGMIRGFQEANFSRNYSLTIEGKGYSVPNFRKVAEAYELDYKLIKTEEDIKFLELSSLEPCIIEIEMPMDTTLNPNFGRKGLIQDQRPYIDKTLYEELMKL